MTHDELTALAIAYTLRTGHNVYSINKCCVCGGPTIRAFACEYSNPINPITDLTERDCWQTVRFNDKLLHKETTIWRASDENT